MPVKLQPIDPDMLYSASEAAALIPGRAGPVSPVTITNWCKSGRLQGRQIGMTWHVMGSELLRLRDGVKPDPEPATTAS